MESQHSLEIGDARDLSWLEGQSVDLVVTSPPYPMIRMWDELFCTLQPELRASLDAEKAEECFQIMHAALDPVWRECFRVMRDGGILCVNVGDATRTLGSGFRLYPNHARIISACTAAGFQMLPEILWRKQTNAPNKFVGSGTLPPGAYVTLEHEWILPFRKSLPRVFATEAERTQRRQSAFFWEERNIWFSDLWELKGIRQRLNGGDGARSRSAAFPLEIPYRLISMFSVKGDRVLDPFAGCGTTLLAAMCTGRNSVGVEIDDSLLAGFQAQAGRIVAEGNRRILERLDRHRRFIEERKDAGGVSKYTNRHYGFPVVSRQEREILINFLRSCTPVGQRRWRIEYCAEASLELPV